MNSTIDRRASSGPTDVVLVSESKAHAQLVQDVFEDERTRTTVHVVRDRVAARQFLDRRRPYTDAPRPSLVLLDLDESDDPDADDDWQSFLASINEDPEYARIPVIILGAAAQAHDSDADGVGDDPTRERAQQEADTVQQCYDLHANAYVPVPAERDAFVETLRRIEAFWMSTVRLPYREDRIR